jgi:hypothetical protein
LRINRYCRIDEASHSFVYGKTPSLDPTASSSIDLLLIPDEIALENSLVSRTFVLAPSNDESYEFRASTAEEAARWVQLLNEWKDYLLLEYASSSSGGGGKGKGTTRATGGGRSTGMMTL